MSTEVASAVGGLKALTSTGTSILVQGTLRRTPEGTLQVPLSRCIAIVQLLGHETPTSRSSLLSSKDSLFDCLLA